jgi:hypothetical protein
LAAPRKGNDGISPDAARQQGKNSKKEIIFKGRNQIFEGNLQKSGYGAAGLVRWKFNTTTKRKLFLEE